MATPSSSSSPPDAVIALPSTAASAAPPRPALLSSMPPTVPVHRRPPIFAAHPILGKHLNPPPTTQTLFSTGAAGRAHPHRPSAARSLDQTVTLANPAVGYVRNICPTAAMAFAPVARPHVFASDPASSQIHPPPRGRPPQPSPQPRSVAASGPKGASLAAQPKVSSLQTIASTPEYNNCKDRDKSKEDCFVTVHNRKVRLLEDGSTSLYALCRSWLRNGYSQETQPNFGDGVRLLPRPLPASAVDIESSDKSDGDNEVEDPEKEELVGSVDQLSSHDLLEGLKKRSKRVRAQFTKERLRRIARYKQRLSLLVPPPPLTEG